jgi:hypothetical protein
MRMTRKDYIRFAAMFKVQRAYVGQFKSGDMMRLTIESIANETATIFEQDNARFDRARFLKACGVES